MRRDLRCWLLLPVLGVTAAACAGGVPPRATMGFVRRSATTLNVAGSAYRFVGVNVFSAAARAAADCEYGTPYGTGTGFDTLLDGLPARPGGYVVRVLFTQQLATNAGMRDWSSLDHTVGALAARGWRAIVSLGDEWGNCDAGADKKQAWYETGYRSVAAGDVTSYRQWARDVAARYAGDPTVLAWTLVNEAQAGGDGSVACDGVAGEAALAAWSDDMTGVVRSVDRNHLIAPGYLYDSCGTWQAAYQRLHARPRVDLCDYHDYAPPGEPLGSADPFRAADALAYCTAAGRAPFVGETGIKVTDVAGQQQRADDFAAKLSQQLGHGSNGETVWLWGCHAYPDDPYVLPPGDPALPVLAAAIP
jgi:mannan endo-1,4-beta-mannosidase